MIVKNVRRRLYDALNVMIAAGIVEKRHNGSLKLISKNVHQVKNISKMQANE